MIDHKCELVHLEKDGLRFIDTIDERITEWKYSWPKGELSYRLNSYSNDIKKKWQARAVTVALRAWRLRLKDLSFRRERNPDVHVDINVEFEDLDHFDGKKGVLAHAYYPGQGDISGDCHINDEWNWSAHAKFQTLSKPPLTAILIHEFGHSLGLVHNNFEKDSIMYPSFNLGETKNKLNQSDIDRIQSKYGKRKLSQRLLDVFRDRIIRGTDFR